MRPIRSTDPVSVNRAVWSNDEVVARFSRAEGWIDSSESKLYQQVIVENVDNDLLDIGVGGGRTVSLFAPKTHSYVAIDFVPELVEAARKRYPTMDIRHGDARHLDFDDAHFDVVVFSINGIDSLGHADRAVALSEIRRVLRPGGVFLFSTHNFDGPGRSDRPWRLPPMTIRQPRSSARELLGRVAHQRRSINNYRTLHAACEEGDGWAINTSGAHDFGILVHYVSREILVEQLRQAGFGGEVEIWDDRKGRRLTSQGQRCWYFNVLARCSLT